MTFLKIFSVGKKNENLSPEVCLFSSYLGILFGILGSLKMACVV